MRDVGFVLGWLVMLPLTFQGAHLGVLIWAWTSLLAPNDVLYGVGASVPFAKVAAIPAMLMLLARRGGGIAIGLNPTVAILLALAVCGFVSQAVSLMNDAAAGWDLYQKFVKILLLCAVVTWVMRDRVRVHALLFAICLGLGFTGVGEGMKFLLSGGGHKVIGTSSTGDNNQIALDVLMTLPMLQYLYVTARTRLLRLACLGSGLLSAVCVIATASRGGFAGLLIVALGTVLTSRRKLQGLAVIVLMGVVASQLVSSDYTQRMNSIETASQDDESFLGRVTAWKIATTEALDRPLTGGGFHAAQYPEIWLRYSPRIGWLDFIPSASTEFLHAAHSIYFEMLGDLGFPGLTLFLLLFALAWRNAGWVRRRARRSGRADLAWTAELATKLQISLVVFVVCGGLLSAAYYDIEYLIVGVLAVLRGIVARGLASGGLPENAAKDRRLSGAGLLPAETFGAASDGRPVGR